MILWILFLIVGTGVTCYLTLSDNAPATGGAAPYALFAFVLLFTGSLVAVTMHGTKRTR